MSNVDPPQGPPQGPPSGPPSGPPQGPSGPPPEPTATNPPEAATADARRRNLLIVGIAALLIVVLIAVAVASRGSGKKSASGETSGEVFLEPAADPGANPFTESVAEDTPSTTVPDEPIAIGAGVTAPPLTEPAPGATGIASYRGGVPGLYGGTRDLASCDANRMADFLAASPAKAKAWADVQGITVAEVPDYVRSLTPVVLRGDTRVTNYGYENGVATPHQSVLQAGTAVLVDRYGEPQAKCACGNPLNPPVPTSEPTYQGAPWPRFTPGGVTVVVKNITVIKIITIIDIETGKPFGRPTGPDPGPDQPAPKGPPNTTPNSTPGDGSSGSASSSGDCDGESFTLVQTLTVPTTNSDGVTTQSFDAKQCVRFVATGEVDLNKNNSLEGGFDAVYCYDPQYCDPAKATVQWLGGQTIADALSLPTPGRSSSHTYSFTFRQAAAGSDTFALKDVDYSDNTGSITVKVYTSGGSGGSSADAVKYDGKSSGTIGCISCDGQSRFLALDDDRIVVGNAAGATIAKTWTTAGRVVSFRATLNTSANKGRYGIALFRNSDGTYLAGCAVEIGQTSCSSTTRGAPMRAGDKLTIIVGESGPDTGNFTIDWSFDFEPDS